MYYFNFLSVFFLIQDMSEVDVVKNHFEVSDSNHDGQLDSREWLGYMRENLHSLKRDKKSRILRQEFFFFKETLYRHSSIYAVNVGTRKRKKRQLKTAEIKVT